MSALVRIGTRGSKLARAQASTVRDQLAAAHPETGFELIIVHTSGDRDTSTPLAAMGAVGVFAAELRQALLSGEVDLAVHSLKDLPTEPVPGLTLAAITARVEPCDVAVTRDHTPLAALPAGARIGTSSPRRRAWLRAHHPHLEPVELRGNVPTRVSAVEAGRVDGVLLAAAGLTRLDLLEALSERLPLDTALPAPGQGAVAVEGRQGDPATAMAGVLHDAATAVAVEAERACLAALGGGCAVPLGALGELEGDVLHLRAAMPGPDGGWLAVQVDGAAADPVALGAAAAAQLRAAGAVRP